MPRASKAAGSAKKPASDRGANDDNFSDVSNSPGPQQRSKKTTATASNGKGAATKKPTASSSRSKKAIPVDDSDDDVAMLPANSASARNEAESDDDIEFMPRKPLPAFMMQLNPSLASSFATPPKRKADQTDKDGSSADKKAKKSGAKAGAEPVKSGSTPTPKDPAARLKASRGAKGASPAPAGPSSRPSQDATPADASPTKKPSQQGEQHDDGDNDKDSDFVADDDDDDDDDDEGAAGKRGANGARTADPNAFRIPAQGTPATLPQPQLPAGEQASILARLQASLGGAFDAARPLLSALNTPNPASVFSAMFPGSQETAASSTTPNPSSETFVFPMIVKRAALSSAPLIYSPHLQVMSTADSRTLVFDGQHLVGELEWSISFWKNYIHSGHVTVRECVNLYIKRMPATEGLVVAVLMECHPAFGHIARQVARQVYARLYRVLVDGVCLMSDEFESLCTSLKLRFPTSYVATEARKEPNIQEEFDDIEDAELNALTAAAGEQPQLDDLFQQMQTTDNLNGTDALTTLISSKDQLFDVATLPNLPERTAEQLRRRGLKTELKSHQSQGVTYMIRQEHPILPQKKSDPTVALWKKTRKVFGENVYVNIATSKRSRNPGPLPRGGILADGMGLGKTLQVLALVLSDPTGKGVIDQNFKGVLVDEEDVKAADAASTSAAAFTGTSTSLAMPGALASPSKASSAAETSAKGAASSSKSKAAGPSSPSKEGKVKQKRVNSYKARELKELDTSYNKTTLIVCPLSVIVNWQQQIEAHCDMNKVSYYVWHGDKLRDVCHDFSKYDFVIVTYDTVKRQFYHYQKKMGVYDTKAEDDSDAENGTAPGSNKLQFVNQFDEDVKEQKPKYKAPAKKDIKGKGKAKADPDKWSDDEEETEKKPNYKIGMELTDESDDDWDSPVKRNDRSKAPSPLFEYKWRRMVLDEGHVCRNPKTKLFEAIKAVNAERVWSVTGTPIVNSTRDLQALVSILRVAPLDDPKAWTKLIDRRIKKGQRAGLQLLQVLIRSHILRRTKGMDGADGQPLVPLPTILYARHQVELDPETREFYDEVEAAMKEVILNWISHDVLKTSRGHVLVFLSRLRQIACHRSMVPSSFLEVVKLKLFEAAQSAGAASGETEMSEEEIARLQEQLVASLESNEECPICIDVLTDPRITYCGHVFCFECIRQCIMSNAKCPLDRRDLPLNTKLIEPPPEKSHSAEDDEGGSDDVESISRGPDLVQSAKIEQLIMLLNQTAREDNEIKSLVFSNFVGFLDHIAAALRKAGITYCRFDGTMSIERRNAVLENFSSPNPPMRKKQTSSLLAQLEDAQAGKRAKAAAKGKLSAKLGKMAERDGLYEPPRVMLLSIGSGALGLNLVQASQVFLMDPWWQSAIEAQAIDRVHRIGQKREIRVVQMLAKGTVEERVLEIQKKKEELIQDAFSSVKNRGKDIKTGHDERETRGLDELVRLFGIRRSDVNAIADADNDDDDGYDDDDGFIVRG
ncbi:hypothetical protein V8E36_003229 [Tilletia maclaganii]